MKLFGAIGSIILVILLAAIILALPLMLLWNWLMPSLFGVNEITFLQALGIRLLASILFNQLASSSEK